MIVASVLSYAPPLLVFAACLVIFRVRARREGKTTQQWLDDRNRATFSRRGPRIVFAVSATIVLAGVIAATVVQLSGG